MLDGTDLGMDLEIRALSARGDIGFDVVSKGSNKFLDFRLIGNNWNRLCLVDLEI